MSSRIFVYVGAPDHWKFAELGTLLSIDAIQAFGHVVALWVGAAQQRSYDGCLRRWPIQTIATEARWRGDPQKFVDALVQSELLDTDGSKHYSIHHYGDEQGPLFRRLAYDKTRPPKRNNGQTAKPQTPSERAAVEVKALAEKFKQGLPKA